MRRWMFFTQADCVTIGTQVMREVRMFDEKLLNKAEALYIRCRLDEAFPLFMELAGAGCGRAMYFLGEYYNHGLGSIKDRNETEARYWHGKGAAVGELLSQLNLAYMEDPRSEERAVLCRGYFPSVVKAAEAGDIVAADELGDMYLYGFGVEKSGKQAVFWLEKGVEKGYWRSLNVPPGRRSGRRWKKSTFPVQEGGRNAFQGGAHIDRLYVLCRAGCGF